MAAVLAACVFPLLSGIYCFGWRVLACVLFVNACCVATEYLFLSGSEKPIAMSSFVTGTLLALLLPPDIPFWMLGIGAAFAISFGKMVYGGHGCNIFNPAALGYCFLFLLSPSHFSVPDHVHGETSVLAVVFGLAVMFYLRAAQWRLVTTALLGLVACRFLLYACWYDLCFSRNIASGVLMNANDLLCCAFMVTDPVTAPHGNGARWIYGLLIGATSSGLLAFTNIDCALPFAILIGNIFAPIMDVIGDAFAGSRKPGLS